VAVSGGGSRGRQSEGGIAAGGHVRLKLAASTLVIDTQGIVCKFSAIGLISTNSAFCKQATKPIDAIRVI